MKRAEMVNPGELLFLFDRALSGLANADSDEGWRLMLADFVKRIGELIEAAPPSGTVVPAGDPAIAKLVAAVAVGYQAPPHRTTERRKLLLDLLLIMGRDAAEDALIVADEYPGISQDQLQRLLNERMQLPSCRAAELPNQARGK